MPRSGGSKAKAESKKTGLSCPRDTESTIAAGDSWFTLDLLKIAVSVFQAFYQNHIAFEESAVDPRA